MAATLQPKGERDYDKDEPSSFWSSRAGQMPGMTAVRCFCFFVWLLFLLLLFFSFFVDPRQHNRDMLLGQQSSSWNARASPQQRARFNQAQQQLLRSSLKQHHLLFTCLYATVEQASQGGAFRRQNVITKEDNDGA